jgi:hypothetical protein
LSDFNETGIFRTDLNKGPQDNISQKSARLETSCSMRPDGLTDLTKVIITFRIFASALNNTNRTHCCIAIETIFIFVSRLAAEVNWRD